MQALFKKPQPKYSAFLLNNQEYQPAANSFEGLTEGDKLNQNQQTLLTLIDSHLAPAGLITHYDRQQFFANSQDYLNQALFGIIAKSKSRGGPLPDHKAIALLQMLLDNGADLRQQKNQLSLLQIAAKSGFIAGVKFLTSPITVNGTCFTLNPSFHSEHRLTALLVAGIGGQREVIDYLLKNTSATLAETDQYCFANLIYFTMAEFHYALSRELMQAYPELLTGPHNSGFTPLDSLINSCCYKQFQQPESQLATRRQAVMELYQRFTSTPYNFSPYYPKTSNRGMKAMHGSDHQDLGDNALFALYERIKENVPELFVALKKRAETERADGNPHVNKVLSVMHEVEATLKMRQLTVSNGDTW